MIVRVAIYARFSNADRQNARSCDDQIAACREHALRRGWTVVALFRDDGISGFAMANRPGILAAIEAAGRGDYDALLSEDEDRLARNLGHLAAIKGDVEHAGGWLATLSTDRVELMHVAFKGAGAEQYLVDLGRKTARGMRANAERGLATGSRKFGYRTQPGGAIAVDPDEAAAIVAIFTAYVDEGLSFRELANRLNRDRVPTTRGGAAGWCASTIHGDAGRGTGILRSEIYAGVKVWNRDTVKKDPRTGRRKHHFKPPAEWRRTPVPELRIVPQPLWDAAQARLAGDRHAPLAARGNRRKPGLFAGLLKCAQCGSTIGSHGKNRLVCVGHREKGPAFCSFRKVLKRDEIEHSVLQGLKARLLTPAATRAYVRAYHAAYARQAAAQRDRRAPLVRREAELAAAIGRLVDTLTAAPASAALLTRLAQLEAEQAQVAAELAQAPDPAAAVTIHPQAAEAYARLVAQLAERLQLISEETAPAAAAGDRKAVDAVRALVERIDVVDDATAPAGARLRISGNLNLLLSPDPREDGPASGDPMVPGGGYTRAPTSPPIVFDWPLQRDAA